ncbi:MAG: hypothetical protein JWO11_3100 [Nocardioides sp.]|nr:hypothetical protein [Nocardioides sp.]
MTLMSKLVGTIAATVLLCGTAISGASAAVVENLHFQDSGSEPFTFCEGIDAVRSWDDQGHELMKTKGNGGLVYFKANVRGTTSFTNLATGKAYTNVYRITDRDQKVTDNGDGTLTITIATSGMNKWYDGDGERVFVTAGQFRFQVMVDDGGTPTDPSDDVEIEGSFVQLKVAGRNPTAGRDFCADLALFTA